MNGWTALLVSATLGVFMSAPSVLHAQAVRTIQGRVLAVGDSTPLAGVLVDVVDLSIRAETTADGRYALTDVPRRSVQLIFTRIGLVPDTVIVGPLVFTLDVYLQLSAIPLAAIQTQAQSVARERFETVAQTSTVSLSPREIANTPTLAEPDPARVVQLTPGVVTKNDYTIGFNVRGGETDQNLIQLDGVPMFNPSHLGGMFSTFDNNAVGQVDFIGGAQPALYSSRLSSVMNVDLRDGSRAATTVHGLISALAAKLLVEGPVANTGITYMVGARRTYVDAVAKQLTDDGLPYYFVDALGKLSVPMPAGGSISLTGYVGRDVLDTPWVDPEPGREGVDLEFDWGNRLAGLTWRQPLAGILLEQHFSASAFSTRLELVPDVVRLFNKAAVLTARTTLAISPRKPLDVRLGVSLEDYSMDYDFESTSLETSILSLRYRPRVWSAFVDAQWHPVGWFLIRPGVRVDRVEGGANETVASPRVGLKAFLTSDLALVGSAGRFHQPIHSVRDQELPITLFEFWIGADDVTPISQADQAVLGFEKWFGASWSVSVEGFFKRYERLVRQNIADDPKIRGDEFILTSGDAYGGDVLVRKYFGRWTGWLSYSYAWTSRVQADGTEFAPSHDRRHTFNLLLQGPGPLGSDMGVRLGYGSPLPYTDIVGQWLHREYNAGEHTFDRFDDEAVSTAINNERFPYYSRIDVGFRWDFEKWGVQWRPFVQIVNVLNRTNVWVYTFNFDRSPPTRTGLSQLPFFPTVGLEFEW